MKGNEWDQYPFASGVSGLPYPQPDIRMLLQPPPDSVQQYTGTLSRATSINDTLANEKTSGRKWYQYLCGLFKSSSKKGRRGEGKQRKKSKMARLLTH